MTDRELLERILANQYVIWEELRHLQKHEGIKLESEFETINDFANDLDGASSYYLELFKEKNQ